ncbi:MAG: aminotransferase class III-fold pyridoxal phosphate-dependent enzyme [Armatimonadetes bacterium]|nr:aminotransferase class III-fold pyridoxal phosphate-dependent enzyme [Armatimonadota bacterium]
MQAARIVETNRRHVLFSWSVQSEIPPVPVVRGEGCHLYDADGRAYLDFSSGLINTNLGHSHPRVVEAIRVQAGRLQYAVPGLPNDVRGELARRLWEVSPGRDLVKTLFTTGGAEAVENAIKIAWEYTGRRKILTNYRSYHGATLGAISASGDSRRWDYEPGVPGFVRIFGPYPYRSHFGVPPEGECEACLRHVEEVVRYEGAETIAGILVEPIIGGNGVIVPPDGYLQGLRAICDRHGFLLIIDEVMTGFGRTGAWFACDHWNVVPDLMTFAKGVTSGYVPLGGVMISSRIADWYADRYFGSGLTYSGHPLACAAGLAALDAYQEDGLIERARVMGGVLETELRRVAARHPSVGDVRGMGLFYCLELVKDRRTKAMLLEWNGPDHSVLVQVLDTLLARGVFMFGRWNCLFVAPPLIVTEAEMRRGAEVLDEVLAIADQAAG